MNWLEHIVCGFQTAIAWLLGGIVRMVDAIVAGVALLGTAAVSLLPEFPELPTLPAEYEQAISWVNWVIPVGVLVAVFVTVGSLWLIWLTAQAGLRWVKGIE